jgi:hypothetical protein
VALVVTADARSQPRQSDTPPAAEDERASLGQALNFTKQLLARKIEEQAIFQALGEIAQVEKVRYTGPPPRVAKNPTAPGPRTRSSSRPTRSCRRST